MNDNNINKIVIINPNVDKKLEENDRLITNV